MSTITQTAEAVAREVTYVSANTIGRAVLSESDRKFLNEKIREDRAAPSTQRRK